MHRHYGFLVALLFLACAGGCSSDKPRPVVNRPPENPEPVAYYRQGTVGEFATLDGGINIRVSGYGLVVGLGTRGDSGAPSQIERYLTN